MSSCFCLKTLSGSKPIACRGTPSVLEHADERPNTLRLHHPVVLALPLKTHTQVQSLFHVQALPLPSGNLNHVPFAAGFMSQVYGILLSHGVRLHLHPCCPGSSLQMLLFRVVLETEPKPQSGVWLGLVGICHIFDHLATYFEHPLLGPCLCLSKESEPALQASLAAKVWACDPDSPDHVQP